MKTYTLFDGITKARIAQSSLYLRYFENKSLFKYSQDELSKPNEKVFYLSSYDNNENIYLKNVNPVFRELYEFIKVEIRREVY